MDANLDASASVQILPRRSQIFVALLALMSAAAFLIGCLFLWHGKPDSWVPLSFSVVFLFSATAAWLTSHKNTDLHGAHPTRVQMTSNGLQVEADSRVLASNQQFQQLEKIVSMVGHRAPLPEPDGLVSSSGQPLPVERANAMERVRQANDEAERATIAAAQFLCGSRGTNEIEGAAQVPIQPPEISASLSRNALEGKG